ncbi:MAG: hypothetical protein MUE40_06015 [Anaerolineae bacterium]|nr:hypothetical protein [Anaerolineae bacterium]
MVIILLVVISPALAQENSHFLQNLPGTIAYIGADYNVYNLDFAAKETTSLTTDAAWDRRYQWVTWSNDGHLAYFCCDLATAGSPETAAYVSSDGQQPGQVVFEGSGEAIIYASWSPGQCAAGTRCRDLAMLVNDVFNGTLRVDLVRASDDTFSSRTIADGSPFYYSWSPDGSRMVLHRNNRSLDLYSLNDDRLTELQPDSPGTYQSPAWSPVDDRILAGVDGDVPRRTSLTITADGVSELLVSNVSGLVSFAWSPDGNYIAYRNVTEDGFGALFVVDAVSGEVISRSLTNDVIAFFWSPDSRKVAYVTRSEAGSFNSAARPSSRQTVQYVQQEAPLTLSWSTLEVGTGLNRRYSSFVPSRGFVYLLLYFDQFAQSHRIWAPDSSSILYSELTTIQGREQPIISILDVRQPNTVPVTVADGSFAVWSFR